MSTEFILESPLVGLQPGPGQLLRHAGKQDVELLERPFTQSAILRAKPESAAANSLSSTLGLQLPTVPNTVSHGNEVKALWLSPEEWLICASENYSGNLVGTLEEVFSGTFHAVVDQSNGNSTIDLRGTDTRAILNTGCPLDLHPSVFKKDQCAQSVFFQAGIILSALSADGSHWELVVRRSFADYVAQMLVDAIDLQGV